MDYFIEKITLKINQKIEIADLDLFKYGLKLMINKSIFLLLVALVSYNLTKTIWINIFFTFPFLYLREMCGGFHFCSKTICFIVSFFLFTLVPIAFSWFVLNELIYRIILLLMFIVIFLISPIDHKNKQITKNERVFFKKKLISRLLVLILIGLVGLSFHNQYIHYIGLSVICNGISILIALFLKKGDVSNEVIS